jgi:nucleoside-diphosphate-sugar epimerase
MNILVTGGAGYLGGALTDLLLISNYNFKVYDNLTYENEYQKPCPFIYGDILDKEKLKKELNNIDVLVHLAAIVGDPACEINREETYNINQKSVQWISENFDGRIIFCSTCSVFGANQGILTEESDTNPLSTYAITKLKAEEYLYNKNSFIVRLGTLFGISDIFSRIRLDLVVNTLTHKTHYKNKMTVFGGEQYRPLLHVKDAAEAIFKAIDSEATGMYNIHYNNYKIIDIANIVHKYYPNSELEIVEQMFQDSRNYQVDSSKIRKKLNWNPQYNIDYGVKELQKIFSENRIKNTENERYYNHLYLKNL